MRFFTPLRYPGGKGRLASYIAGLLAMNGLEGGCYCEPFCGGAGIALSLLHAGKIKTVHLNDSDVSVYAFWHSALYENEKLKRMIQETPVDMDTWYRQREIQCNNETADLLELGFSTFFLNRTNRSGILNGGVIGGKAQTGKWKIDARFNKSELIKRIEFLGHYADSIYITGIDAFAFIDHVTPSLPENTLIYFDPPYFNKGRVLYKNHFTKKDHAKFANKILTSVLQGWIISYDNVAEIANLYSTCAQEVFSLNYSVDQHTTGSELMIFKDGIRTPACVYSSRTRVT